MGKVRGTINFSGNADEYLNGEGEFSEPAGGADFGAFSFTPVTEAASGIRIESEVHTVAGTTNTVFPVTVRGDGDPQIRRNGEAWGKDLLLINGDELEVRLTSSEDGETETTATVYAPGQSAEFSVTTAEEAGFAPPTLSNLKFWGENSYSDTALTTLVTADGSSVAGIEDESAGNYHLTQSTSGSRPTLKTNIFGAKSAWRLDGGDIITNATLGGQLTTDWTVAIVMKKASPSGDTMLWMWGDVSAGERRALWIDSSGYAIFSGYAANVTTTTNVANNAAHYIVITRNSGLITIYIDGTSINSGSPSLSAYASTIFALGGNNDGSELFAGDVRSLIVYSDAKTGADLTSLHTYLASQTS